MKIINKEVRFVFNIYLQWKRIILFNFHYSIQTYLMINQFNKIKFYLWHGLMLGFSKALN